MPRSRNSSRSKTVAERLERVGIESLCDRLIDGQALRQIARDVGVSPAGVLRWINGDEDRRRVYALARVAQADVLANEIIAIADEPVTLDENGRMDPSAINEKRVRIDARKWIASKLKPQVYGDRLDLSANVEAKLTPEQAVKRVQVLLDKLGWRLVSAGDGPGVVRPSGSDAQRPS